MVVPSNSGPTAVRKLEELGATVEVYGKVPPNPNPRRGVRGVQRGLSLTSAAHLCLANPIPKCSPPASPAPQHHSRVTLGTLTRSAVPQPLSDKGHIPGFWGALWSPAEPHLAPPRCGMMPTGEPRSWLGQRAGSTSTPSITPWCGECCQDSAPAPGPRSRGPGWPGEPQAASPCPPPCREGHASLVRELKDSLEAKPGAIVVAVGGGGLLAGVVAGLHQVGWQDVPIIAAETHGAHSFHEALKAGRLVTLPDITR